LVYPNEMYQVFENHWGFLPCLGQHPDYKYESEHTQRCMNLFCRGLSGMAATGTFELPASAKAKEEDVLIAERAAVSRLCPPLTVGRSTGVV
jgi:hypothetical protein